MQSIQIRKKIYTDLSFNPHGYEKALRVELPFMSEVEIQEIVKYVSEFYHKMIEFDTGSEEHLIKRNIARQQLVYSNATDDKTNAFQSDVIVLGETRNWPRFKDIAIRSFKNKDFNFSNLSSPTELLMAHRLATLYIKSLYPKYDYAQLVQRPTTVAKTIAGMKVKFDKSLMGSAIDLIKLVYGATLNTENYYFMSKQLVSVGLADMVNYCLHGNKAAIKKLISASMSDAQFELMRKNNQHMRLLGLSEYNLIKNIIETELDNPAKYLGLLEKTKNVDQFYSLISAGDKKKIQKIIGERAKKIFAKPCAHAEPYEAFMDLYKITYPWVSNQRDKIRDVLLGFLEFDEASMKYFCNSCGQYVMCKHTFDLAGVKQKLKIVEQYRDPEDASKKYSYCKYCSEQIYRNELEEIMTTVKFEEIVRSRSQTMVGDTQSAAFENGLYFGIANAISSLKFDYEFASRQLIKSIMSNLYNIVYGQLSKLHAENDIETYEKLASVYGFVYTGIYMMRTFMADPRVSTLDNSPKNQDAYAKYFVTKVSQRFGQYSTPENTRRLMFQAYVDLKPIGDIAIMAKTESDYVLEILQHPLYGLLYKMHICGYPHHSPVEAFKYIVTQSKPNVMNFYVNAKVPTKGVSKLMRDIYTFWMDYNNPHCYIFSLNERPTDAAKDLVYDNALYKQLISRRDETEKRIFLTQYVKMLNSTPVNPFSRSYGANYIYDDEGDLIVWSEKYEWTTKSGKTIKFSDIKSHVDSSTPEKLAKRNAKIGYKEHIIKKVGTSEFRFVELDNPPEYNFDQKMLGIVSKIDNKYSPNILEYLGRSEGYDYAELIRGVIPGIENYTIGYSKVKYYCQLFIEQYYFLKYNPMNQENLDIVEELGIDFTKINSITDKMAELNTKKYYDESRSLANLFEPQKFYHWQIESLARFITLAEKSSELGRAFVAKFLKFLIRTEKRLSLPNSKKLAGGFVADEVQETEYDELVDNAKYDDDNEIDFEQDEDDINDD